MGGNHKARHYAVFSSPLVPATAYVQILSDAHFQQSTSPYIPPLIWKTKFHTDKTKEHGISQIKTNLMQHCAVFISAESLYMFRAQASIIRSI